MDKPSHLPSFLQSLNERARISAMDQLAEWQHDDRMFIQFSDILKLGINPQTPYHSTPIGIYAYPLADIMADLEAKTIRFAGDRKFIMLFYATGSVLDLRDVSDDDFAHAHSAVLSVLTTLCDKPAILLNRLMDKWLDEAYSGENGPAVYRVVQSASVFASRITNRPANILSNLMFRQMGYDGLVDHGDGIIHSNEPCQAVFFSKAGCRVVDVLMNDHLK